VAGGEGAERVVIAMVTHDSRPQLARLLDRQLAVAERLGIELIAVDNASRDGGLDLLRDTARRSSALRLVSLPRNRGYAAGVNAAFAAAPGRDVLLINPDVELADPGVVERLARLLEAYPRAAVVAPRLTADDGSIQPSARRFPSLVALVATLPRLRGLGLARRAHGRFVEPSQASRTVSVDWVIGAAMMIRRRAYEAVGGWDESFFLYMEDADFCRRCARAGWEIAYAPELALCHGYARASSNGASLLRDRARRRHVASLVRFFAREPRMVLGGGRRPGLPAVSSRVPAGGVDG
jgi:N-acetylglucosaminyl-diphospho-decaprenol L-rhamnosyltransferase